jgi:hypothetical protein
MPCQEYTVQTEFAVLCGGVNIYSRWIANESNLERINVSISASFLLDLPLV